MAELIKGKVKLDKDGGSGNWIWILFLWLIWGNNGWGGDGAGTDWLMRGQRGGYWTKSLRSTSLGYRFFFNSSGVWYNGTDDRYWAYPIRAVIPL